MNNRCNHQRRLTSNTIAAAAAHLVGRGSLVIASMLLANALTITEFAKYSYFQLTASMLAAYASMGLGVAGSKFFSLLSTPNVDHDSAPVGTLWVIATVTGLAFGVITWLLPGELLHNNNLQLSPALLGFGVFVISLSVIPSAGINGLELHAQSFWVSCLAAGVLLTGTLIAVSMKSSAIAIYSFLAGSLIQAAGHTWLTIKTAGFKAIFLNTTFKKEKLRSITLLAGPMFLVSLLSATGPWLVGRILLGSENGQQAFALYSIGLQWFGLALFLPGVVSRVALPLFVKLDSHKERDSMLKSAISMTVATSLFVSLIGYALLPWLLALYGSAFKNSQNIIAIFLLAALLYAPANTIGNAIVSRNGQISWLIGTIISFTSLIITSLVTLPLGHISGPMSLCVGGIALSTTAVILKKLRSEHS